MIVLRPDERDVLVCAGPIMVERVQHPLAVPERLRVRAGVRVARAWSKVDKYRSGFRPRAGFGPWRVADQRDPLALAGHRQTAAQWLPSTGYPRRPRISKLIGIPLALGSWWGLVVLAITIPVLVWRILDEEKLLEKDLTGYKEYEQRVRYRLVPYLW